MNDDSTTAMATTIVGMVCSNTDVSIVVVGFILVLLAHFGLSITSALLKKYATYAGAGTAIIRTLAIDVHPKDSAIVNNAAQVVASKPEVMEQTGVDPARMVAAANQIKATE
jgi:hypothetical protein